MRGSSSSSAPAWSRRKRRTGSNSPRRGNKRVRLRFSLSFPKGCALVQLVDIGGDVRAFLRQEFVDGTFEGGVREPMEGARRFGKEAAGMLVLALRAPPEDAV